MNKSSQKAFREIDKARTLLLEKYSLSNEAVEGVLRAHSAGLVVWSDTFMHTLLSLTTNQEMTDKKINTNQGPPSSLTNIASNNTQSVGSEIDTARVTRVNTQIQSQVQPQPQPVNVVTHLGWQKILPRP
jgi:hypothetical protein